MTDSLPALLALHRAGHLDEAERGYRGMITASGSADAMQLLASLLHQTGRSAEALHWIEQALPSLAQRDAAESNRAAMLLALELFDQAIAACDAVLARNPGHVGAIHNRRLALLGTARAESDLMAQVAAYRCFIAAGGDDAQAWLEYGNALQCVGAAEVAVAAFDRASTLAPDAPGFASAALIAAHFDVNATTAALSARAAHASVGYRRTPASRPGDARDRLCFGFYSPRFGDGPIASLVLPVLRKLRERGVRIVLYSGFDQGSADAAAFQAVANAWIDVGALDDIGFAEQVARVRVGVMFDLCGHAPGNRLGAFASRLAPLQVSWGDWFCTTGLPAMDLFIGDEVTTPPVDDPHFSERVVRMPRSRFVFELPDDAPQPRSIAADTVCFASFNRLSKLTDQTTAAWARILAEVAGATLLLRSGGLEQEALRAHTAGRFAVHGIDRARIRFEAFGSYHETLARYRDVRVALDPFPFNGCVTTCDALAMGVPVVALRGHSLVARQSAGLLHAIGCSDWVADDIDGYIARAVALAGATANREARARLLPHEALEIFDCAEFADRLLDLIRTAQA